MDDPASFSSDQGAGGLLGYFQRERERHWSVTPHPRFERFTFDQLHDVETFSVLFSVMTDSRNVRMMNLRSCARFAEKTRSGAGIFRHLPIDHLERDGAIQNRIASAVRNRHRPGAELNREAIGAYLNFKVSIFQSSRQ
jgi:hypothetical protein